MHMGRERTNRETVMPRAETLTWVLTEPAGQTACACRWNLRPAPICMQPTFIPGIPTASHGCSSIIQGANEHHVSA